MPHLKSRRGMNWYLDCEGDGPLVVFIHGWGVDRRIWRQQFKYLSEFYRVVALDLPGHGQTPWQMMSLKEIAADLQEILGEQKESFHVIASSFGGLVALSLAEVAPERIRSFTFVGSQPKFSRAPDYPFGLERERIAKLAGQVERDYPSIVHIFFRSLFSRQERESRRYKWVQTFRRAVDVPQKEALLGLLAVLTEADLREVLFATKKPVLFVNGEEDYICPAGLYDDIKAQLPQAELAWFPGCGHFPFLSQPHEFNALVSRFLSGVS